MGEWSVTFQRYARNDDNGNKVEGACLPPRQERSCVAEKARHDNTADCSLQNSHRLAKVVQGVAEDLLYL